VTQASVFSMVRRSGAYSPPDLTRAERSLTADDRERISRSLAVGDSIRSIAIRIGRTASTISREASRKGGRDRYRAGDSDMADWRELQRSHPGRAAERYMFKPPTPHTAQHQHYRQTR